jgi:hypothetical protein
MTGSRFANIVEAAFSEIFGNAAQRVDGCWNLPLDGAWITARVDNIWLVMTSLVIIESDPLKLLTRNGGLPGGVKFGCNGCLEARVEIPMDEDASVTTSIREAWKGFETALVAIRNVERASVAGELPVSQDSLTAACAEAGWSSTPRSDGSLAVELETRGTFVQASLGAGDGVVRVSVALASFRASASDSVCAICQLLLEAARSVRMARPVVATSDGEMKPRFEVVLTAPPDAVQLAHALSALSVAWQQCGEEVKALLKKAVAREYLALRCAATAASDR